MRTPPFVDRAPTFSRQTPRVYSHVHSPAELISVAVSKVGVSGDFHQNNPWQAGKQWPIKRLNFHGLGARGSHAHPEHQIKAPAHPALASRAMNKRARGYLGRTFCGNVRPTIWLRGWAERPVYRSTGSSSLWVSIPTICWRRSSLCIRDVIVLQAWSTVP